jgi:hypothetical protein
MWNVENKTVKYICDSEMGEMAYFTPNSNWKYQFYPHKGCDSMTVVDLPITKILS